MNYEKFKGHTLTGCKVVSAKISKRDGMWLYAIRNKQGLLTWANKHLIEAAPDLLSHCQELEATLREILCAGTGQDNCEKSDNYCKNVCKRRKATEKAEKLLEARRE